VQSTGIGGITSRLRRSLETLILVDRFAKTTKVCCLCGHEQDISLAERIFRCQNCGFEIDRDLNAAINILKLGLQEETTSLKNLPVGCGEVTPVEREASARILGVNPYIRVSYTSLKQEVPIGKEPQVFATVMSTFTNKE